MNPNMSQPGFELPTPMQPGEGANGMVENRPPAPEFAPVPAATSPQAQQSVLPHVGASQQMPPVTAAQPTQQTTNTPLVADDVDLIEKEWVDRAKQIVAMTREDPHEQNKQLSRIKAEYLKKRYNKDIKVEES